MRDFFLQNGAAVTAVIAGCELLLTLALAVLFVIKKRIPIMLTVLIAAGLTFDAIVMLLGNSVPEGTLFLLSRIRFFSHGLLLPLCVTVSGLALRPGRAATAVLWSVTALLCVLGAASGAARVLELRDFAGLLRCTSAYASPVWAEKINRFLSVGTVLTMIAAGAAVLIREKNGFLLLGGLLMLAFSALAPAIGFADVLFLVSMIGELLMTVCFLLHGLTFRFNAERPKQT